MTTLNSLNIFCFFCKCEWLNAHFEDYDVERFLNHYCFVHVEFKWHSLFLGIWMPISRCKTCFLCMWYWLDLSLTWQLRRYKSDSDAFNFLIMICIHNNFASFLFGDWQQSAVYRVNRACILTSFSEFGMKDQTEANFIIPEMKKLSADGQVGNLTIILASNGIEVMHLCSNSFSAKLTCFHDYSHFFLNASLELIQTFL